MQFTQFYNFRRRTHKYNHSHVHTTSQSEQSKTHTWLYLYLFFYFFYINKYIQLDIYICFVFFEKIKRPKEPMHDNIHKAPHQRSWIKRNTISNRLDPFPNVDSRSRLRDNFTVSIINFYSIIFDYILFINMLKISFFCGGERASFAIGPPNQKSNTKQIHKMLIYFYGYSNDKRLSLI